MEPIREGATGAAVEDIQGRLASVGYEVDDAERDGRAFGATTAQAVARFRADHGLSLGSEVDMDTWQTLVNECYQLGDRTLYLRLPNFRGNDVLQLQNRLNTLGFSCGEPDGTFGAYTEAAVKQFQESQGILADGMAFQDTFAAIERLRHVWGGKQANGPHPAGAMTLARAANVLEGVRLSLTAEDPISRNVAGRIWNLASATTERSGLNLVGSVDDARPDDQLILVLSASPLHDKDPVANLVADDTDALPLRLRSTYESFRGAGGVPTIRLELPLGDGGGFTTGDAQTLAIVLLDALCSAFDH